MDFSPRHVPPIGTAWRDVSFTRPMPLRELMAAPAVPSVDIDNPRLFPRSMAKLRSPSEELGCRMGQSNQSLSSADSLELCISKHDYISCC